MPIGRPGRAVEDHDNDATEVVDAFPGSLAAGDASEACSLLREPLTRRTLRAETAGALVEPLMLTRPVRGRPAATTKPHGRAAAR